MIETLFTFFIFPCEGFFVVFINNAMKSNGNFSFMFNIHVKNYDINRVLVDYL